MDWMEEEGRRARAKDKERAEKYRTMISEVEHLSVQGVLPGGAISVTLEGLRLRGLNLSSQAMRLTPDRLAHNILNCIKVAEANYAQAINGILTDGMGAGGEVDEIRKEVREEFPGVESEKDEHWGAGRGISAQERYPVEDDDDEGWNQPILRS